MTEEKNKEDVPLGHILWIHGATYRMLPSGEYGAPVPDSYKRIILNIDSQAKLDEILKKVKEWNNGKGDI